MSADRVTLSLKSPEILPAWIQDCKSKYIEERIAAGEDSVTANEGSEKQFKELFPDNKPAENHLVYDISSGSQVVGTLWIAPRTKHDKTAWWIYDIKIDDAFQRRGLGRQTMKLAEDAVRENGGKKLGLNVFGHNKAARALYDSVGYEATSIQMQKDV